MSENKSNLETYLWGTIVNAPARSNRTPGKSSSISPLVPLLFLAIIAAFVAWYLS